MRDREMLSASARAAHSLRNALAQAGSMDQHRRELMQQARRCVDSYTRCSRVAAAKRAHQRAQGWRHYARLSLRTLEMADGIIPMDTPLMRLESSRLGVTP